MKTILLSIFAIILFSSNSYAYSGEKVGKFETPGQHPTGLCFDGSTLWLADRGSDKLYCINPQNGSVVKTIESPAYWPMGLAWDGKYLWNADFRGRTDKSEDLDGLIYKIDPNDGTILKTLKSPSKCPIGLTWDGKYLWCVDNRSDKVIQFDPNDGTTINSFKSPSKDPTGISFDGKYLWISDNTEDEIYMVDPATGYVIIIIDAPGKYVHGLAAFDKKLWAVDSEDNLVYELKIRDKQKIILKNRKKYKVTFNHNVACYGPGKIESLDVNIALPEDRDNQKILEEIEYNISPSKIITDKWGQKSALFHYADLKPGDKTKIQVTTTFDAYDVRYFIYPEFVGRLEDIPVEISEKYLADNDKYQIDSEIIQNTLKQVVGDEKNPYWIIRKIHQYLIGHLHYVMDGAWDTAPTVLENGHGSCSEYTFAFIALCKAAGIPTRYVGSVWNRKDGTYMDEVYHRWVEIYLPSYGWIPTDPTHSDRESPRGQAFPIGFVNNAALITTQSGGGSETMEWTYNSNENYITEPKTNLDITHYADWILIK